MRLNGLWRKGAGTPEDPNNGRLFWRILGIHPSSWTRCRSYPPHLRPTALSWARLLLNELTRYPSETCQRCGRRVGRTIDSFWRADDDLWIEVVGHEHGILCPLCFTRAARHIGIDVYWKSVVW